MIFLTSSEFVSTDWHLLLCKPNQHHIVLRHLERKGIDHFMPQHFTERRWRGRFKREACPMFAGYVFFGMSPGNAIWRQVKTTPGVSQIIGFGANGPAQVPAEIVAGLMQRCDKAGFFQPDEGFAVGDKVKVTQGPFRDFFSRIEFIDAENRIHMLLDIMGRETRVRMKPDQVIRQT